MINANIKNNNNPNWPPLIDSYILIKLNYTDKTYFGKIISYLNDNQCLVQVLNDPYYVDNSYENGTQIGYMVLVNSYTWNYVSSDKINYLLEQTRNNNNKSNIINYDSLMNENIYNDSSNPKSCGSKIDDIHDPYLYQSDKIRNETLFSDDIVFEPSNIGNPREPSEENMNELKKHLLNFYPLRTQIDPENPEEDPKDMKFIASKTLTVDNLMTNFKEIEREGQIIADKLMFKYVENKEEGKRWLLNDLKVKVHKDGYVHVTREGVKLENQITESLVGKLEILSSEIGKPIDYERLKNYVIITPTQQEIDNRLSKEAEIILSQENLIILQPKPQFQWWCIKRLMQIWYSSKILLATIRKIKILINQYRGDSSKEHNKIYGTLPSIVIYPIYGSNAARSVISTLTRYFAVYNDVGWDCSQPSYTKKISNLIWYSNGSLDLKYYYRMVVKNENIDSGTFENNYSKIRGAEDVVFSNVGLNIQGGGSKLKYLDLDLNLENYILENGYKINPYNLYFNLSDKIKKLI